MNWWISKGFLAVQSAALWAILGQFITKIGPKIEIFLLDDAFTIMKVSIAIIISNWIPSHLNTSFWYTLHIWQDFKSRFHTLYIFTNLETLLVTLNQYNPNVLTIAIFKLISFKSVSSNGKFFSYLHKSICYWVWSIIHTTWPIKFSYKFYIILTDYIISEN